MNQSFGTFIFVLPHLLILPSIDLSKPKNTHPPCAQATLFYVQFTAQVLIVSWKKNNLVSLPNNNTQLRVITAAVFEHCVLSVCNMFIRERNVQRIHSSSPTCIENTTGKGYKPNKSKSYNKFLYYGYMYPLNKNVQKLCRKLLKKLILTRMKLI